MVKINKMLVSKAIQNKLTYGGRNPVDYIVIHQTANTSKGANGKAHARLQSNGNSRQASWHYSVGSDGIYQSFPDTAQAWHAGSRYYNERSIGIELAVNSDGNYSETIELGVKLVKYLMDKYNVPSGNVIRHKDASGKYCPRELLNGKEGITWNGFKRRIGGKSKPNNGNIGPKPPASNKPTEPKPYTVDAKYPKLGNVGPNVLSVQKRLNKHGYKVDEDSSFGPATDKALRSFQKDKGLEVDGSAGPITQKALDKSTSKVKKIAEDGSWGPATTREWQRQAGTTVDGVISGQYPGPISNAIPSANHNGRGGSDLIAAIHKALGMGSGRDIKQATVKALQRKLGTPIDGKISRPRSLMVVEIQKQLNAGTLMDTLRK